MNVDFGQGYAPQQSENGKFVVIDSSTIVGLPSASQGRYAVLTYNIGLDSAAPGASGTNPLYVNVTNPVSINGTISADLIEIENVNISTTVSSIELLPIYVLASALSFSNNLSTVSFNPTIQMFEIFNYDSSNTIFMSFSNITQLATLTAQGLPILPNAYYSIDKNVSQVVVGTNKSADVRVFGHYR
jgi:hypothetical protein